MSKSTSAVPTTSAIYSPTLSLTGKVYQPSQIPPRRAMISRKKILDDLSGLDAFRNVRHVRVVAVGVQNRYEIAFHIALYPRQLQRPHYVRDKCLTDGVDVLAPEMRTACQLELQTCLIGHVAS